MYQYAGGEGPSHDHKRFSIYRSMATIIGNRHKIFGQDRTCSSKDIIADGQSHTDRHLHRNTPLPYRGGVINVSCNWVDL